MSPRGDTKGYDTFQGQPDTDTGMTAVYVGPRILGTLGRWVGEVGADLPVPHEHDAIPDNAYLAFARWIFLSILIVRRTTNTPQGVGERARLVCVIVTLVSRFFHPRRGCAFVRNGARTKDK